MQDIPPEQSLIEYPSSFPIKVMGLNVDGFADAVVQIAKSFDPGFSDDSVETAPAAATNTWVSPSPSPLPAANNWMRSTAPSPRTRW
jgi:putative lipoic acid-binding regulatory protein